MIKIVLKFVLLGILTVVHAANIEGFRSMKWGDGSEVLGSDKIIHESSLSGRLTSYVKQYEKLEIGDKQLSRIIYSFFDNKFYKVYIELGQTQNGVITELIAKYGKSSNERTHCQDYNYAKQCFTSADWKSEKTKAYIHAENSWVSIDYSGYDILIQEAREQNNKQTERVYKNKLLNDL